MLRVASFVVLFATALPAQKTKDFATAMERYEAFGFRGSVLVAKKGKQLYAAGLGMADVEKGKANDADTLFEIASITKQFTAAAILRLEQDGKLRVEDSIADHLPGVPAHSKKITIHHLLAHTSGVPADNTEGRGADLERAVQVYLGDGPTKTFDKKWDYWNGGYAMLAGIVEEVSGKTFMEYCRKNLFAPAGMKDSGFNGSKKLDAKRAARNEGRSAIDHPYGAYEWQYRGMGGAVSTVGDMWKWHTALMGDAVLAHAQRDKLFEPYVRGQAHGADYGYGWFLDRAPDGSRVARHGGSVRGFKSGFRRYPEIDGCIVVLTNGDGVELGFVERNLEGMLFGRKPPHELPPKVAGQSKKKWKPYAGTYRCDAGELVCTATDAGLVVRASGAIAPRLTKDPRTERTEFVVRAVKKGRFSAWKCGRGLEVEFGKKRRKIRSFELDGDTFDRAR